MNRPFDDAQRTALELARRGHEALVAPLWKIRLLDNPEPDLESVQALLATSSNGVRAFARRCKRRDIPVFAVGANTAENARSAGFAHVSSAEADSVALAATIRNSLDPAKGAVLHITGRRSTNGLRQRLADDGFACQIWELYDIVPTGTLPERVVAALSKGAVDAALVLSPESGRDLVSALKIAGLEMQCRHLVACCISSATAEALRDIEFGAIRVAEQPNLKAVLALLDRGCPGRTGIDGFERA